MKPLRDVFGRWIDAIERRHIVDATVVELFRQRLELLLRADEVDGNRVGIHSAALPRELRLDFVRVPVQRLSDPAILPKKMRRLEPRFDANGEGRGHRRVLRTEYA